MLCSAQLEFRSLILEHKVPAVLSIDLYKKNCMSHSSKFMGFLIFSYMAFNHVKWNISFVAFYYRFFVAIKMLLKLIDVNVPSPHPFPICSLALISANCDVINTHEWDHMLAVEKGRLQDDYMGFLVETLAKNASKYKGRCGGSYSLPASGGA